MSDWQLVDAVSSESNSTTFKGSSASSSFVMVHPTVNNNTYSGDSMGRAPQNRTVPSPISSVTSSSSTDPPHNLSGQSIVTHVQLGPDLTMSQFSLGLGPYRLTSHESSSTNSLGRLSLIVGPVDEIQKPLDQWSTAELFNYLKSVDLVQVLPLLENLDGAGLVTLSSSRVKAMISDSELLGRLMHARASLLKNFPPLIQPPPLALDSPPFPNPTPVEKINPKLVQPIVPHSNRSTRSPSPSLKKVPLRHYSYADLERDTSGWNFDNLLSAKPSSMIFRAVSKGSPYIVQRLFSSIEEATFQHLLETLGQLPRHSNIVHCIGMCPDLQLGEKYLVYEDVNGICLSDVLFLPPRDANSRSTLSALRRMQIVRDIAKGVDHLHRQSPPLVLSDISTDNVFLVSGVAKILDLSRIAAVQPPLTPEEDDLRHSRVSSSSSSARAPPITGPPRASLSDNIWMLGGFLLELMTGLTGLVDVTSSSYSTSPSTPHRTMLLTDFVIYEWNQKRILSQMGILAKVWSAPGLYNTVVALETIIKSCLSENPRSRLLSEVLVKQLTAICENAEALLDVPS